MSTTDQSGNSDNENDIVIERKRFTRKVNIIKNFNLVISTSPGFELQAENELWFNLLGAGDERAKIINSNITGLLLARTHLPPRKVVEYFQRAEELEKTAKSSIFNKPYAADSGEKADTYAQFIKKLVPVDIVVKTDIETITKKALELYNASEFAKDPKTTFRITVRKRLTDLKPADIISPVADKIPNKVDLKNYDWVLQIEIIKNYTGISLLRPHEIYEPLIQKKL